MEITLFDGRFKRIEVGVYDAFFPGTKKRFYFAGFLPWVEAPINREAALMQFTEDSKHTQRILPALIGRGANTRNEGAELPALFGVHGKISRIHTDGSRKLESLFFMRAGDYSLCPLARMAIDILLIRNSKGEGSISEPLLDGPEVCDFTLGTAKGQRDVANDTAVGVVNIILVELTELLQGIEFEDHVFGIDLHFHRGKLFHMVSKNLFPESLIIIAHKVIVFQNLHDSRGKRLVPICVAEHDIAVFPALSDTGYIPFAVRDDIPLVGLFRDIHGGIVRLVNILIKGILLKIVIGGTDVAVADEITGKVESVGVIFDVIFGINNDVNAFIFILQVEKGFFFIAQHQDNLTNAGFLQLLNLPLNKDFIFDDEKTLRLFQRERNKAGGQAGRHNDRVIHLIGQQSFQPKGRDAVFVNPPFGREFLQGFRDEAEGEL